VNPHYAALAAVLHELGDRCAALADHAGLADAPAPWVSIDVQPGGFGQRSEDVARRVDIVAAALADTEARTVQMGSGKWFRTTGRGTGAVRVCVYDQVAPPAVAARQRAAEAAYRWGVAS
jgi:hypothetical protein